VIFFATAAGLRNPSVELAVAIGHLHTSRFVMASLQAGSWVSRSCIRSGRNRRDSIANPRATPPILFGFFCGWKPFGGFQAELEMRPQISEAGGLAKESWRTQRRTIDALSAQKTAL